MVWGLFFGFRTEFCTEMIRFWGDLLVFWHLLFLFHWKLGASKGITGMVLPHSWWSMNLLQSGTKNQLENVTSRVIYCNDSTDRGKITPVKPVQAIVASEVITPFNSDQLGVHFVSPMCMKKRWKKNHGLPVVLKKLLKYIGMSHNEGPYTPIYIYRWKPFKKNQQTAGKYTPKNPDTSRIE